MTVSLRSFLLQLPDLLPAECEPLCPASAEMVEASPQLGLHWLECSTTELVPGSCSPHTWEKWPVLTNSSNSTRHWFLIRRDAELLTNSVTLGIHSRIFFQGWVWGIEGWVGLYFEKYQRDDVVKNLPAMRERWVQSLGLGRSPGEGNGNPCQHSCLENPMSKGVWWATVHGVIESPTALNICGKGWYVPIHQLKNGAIFCESLLSV